MKVRPVRLPKGNRKDSLSQCTFERVNEAMYRGVGNLIVPPSDVLYFKRVCAPQERSGEAEASPRKIITVKLSLDLTDGNYDSDDLIARDIEQEISCCWHQFHIIDIQIEN